MTDENKTEKLGLVSEIVLESPPELASSVSELSQTVFGEESIGTMAAKLKLVESLLNLAPRDITFTNMIREILMVVMHTIKCEAGSVFEINYENQTLFFRAASGNRSDQVSNFEIPLGQGIVGHVAESKQPLLITDVLNSDLHAKAISQAVDFEVHTLIAAPIIIRTKTYGVLELLNRVGENSFTAADLELLQYAADMIAKAIEVRLMVNWTRQENAEKAAAA